MEVTFSMFSAQHKSSKLQLKIIYGALSQTGYLKKFKTKKTLLQLYCYSCIAVTPMVNIAARNLNKQFQLQLCSINIFF